MDRREFLERIESVDAALASKGRAPASREFLAYRELAGGFTGPFMGAGINPDDYPAFIGPNLFREICAWYSERYGDKMKAIGPVATIPIVIRTEVYGVRIPLVLGSWEFDSDRVLGMVDGMTPSLRASLSHDEIMGLCEVWAAAFEIVYQMDETCTLAKGRRSGLSSDVCNLLASAREDLDMASEALRQRITPAAPTAVFHSQQLAEKSLKAILCHLAGLSSEDVRKRFGHRMAQLYSACVTHAPSLNGVKSDVDILGAITMDVRYNAPNIPGPQAVNTFMAALRVAGAASLVLCGGKSSFTTTRE